MLDKRMIWSDNKNQYSIDSYYIHENTCRYFNDSEATERALKRHIPDYDRTRKYLENNKWGKDIIADNKMDKAYQLAEKHENKYLYNSIYKAINKKI